MKPAEYIREQTHSSVSEPHREISSITESQHRSCPTDLVEGAIPVLPLDPEKTTKIRKVTLEKGEVG